MMTLSSKNPAVEVENLTKRYKGTVAVDGISLNVFRGETLGILGTNGAGKTTTVEMIAGLRRPDGGRLSVMGLDPTRDRTKLRQVLGVQLQERSEEHTSELQSRGHRVCRLLREKKKKKPWPQRSSEASPSVTPTS